MGRPEPSPTPSATGGESAPCQICGAFKRRVQYRACADDHFLIRMILGPPVWVCSRVEDHGLDGAFYTTYMRGRGREVRST